MVQLSQMFFLLNCSLFQQVSANDPSLLAGYLQVSDDEGKTWSKNWFALHDDFVMYFFKARQVREDMCCLTFDLLFTYSGSVSVDRTRMESGH